MQCGTYSYYKLQWVCKSVWEHFVHLFHLYIAYVNVQTEWIKSFFNTDNCSIWLMKYIIFTLYKQLLTYSKSYKITYMKISNS